VTTTEIVLEPRTRAETTSYHETSRHADVLAFCKDLASKTDLVRLTSMGTSGEGQDMAVLVMSDSGAFTPEEARAQNKIVVMVMANIHAGEVEGKEAILALARDLALGKHGKKVLSRTCLVLIPDFNPDGNDRISPKNRALDLKELEGQVNPESGVGTRYTGQGWNLNRDYTKQEAVETRNLAKLVLDWWPHVFVDCHTTDGSIHANDMQVDTSHSNQQAFGKLLSATRSLLEDVMRKVEKRHGYRTTWYGNYAKDGEPEAGWQTYPALPRFGSHYRGLLGRIDVLLETYSYIDFERRCHVIHAWLLELLKQVARDRRRLIRTVERQEARTIGRGVDLDPRPTIGVNYGVAKRGADGKLAFDYPAHALDGDEVRVLAYDRDSLLQHLYPGADLVRWRMAHRRSFVPTVAVSTPWAYLAPAALADRLRGHGIEFETLPQETKLDVESYVVIASEKTFSPDVAAAVPPPGQAEVPLSQKPAPVRFETVLTVRSERRADVAFPAGTLLVKTAQRTGTLAVYLLEPCSDDGFTRWEFLDAQIKVGQPYPIHRLNAPAAPVAPVAPATDGAAKA
jgi:hypothetical protein